MVELLTCNAAVLAIAALYSTWKGRLVQAARRRRALRERVSYMLWAMAAQG